MPFRHEAGTTVWIERSFWRKVKRVTARAGCAEDDRAVRAAMPDRGIFYAPVVFHPRPTLSAERLASPEVLVPVGGVAVAAVERHPRPPPPQLGLLA